MPFAEKKKETGKQYNKYNTILHFSNEKIRIKDS
jgi:hypothetical protein